MRDHGKLDLSPGHVAGIGRLLLAARALRSALKCLLSVQLGLVGLTEGKSPPPALGAGAGRLPVRLLCLQCVRSGRAVLVFFPPLLCLLLPYHYQTDYSIYLKVPCPLANLDQLACRPGNPLHDLQQQRLFPPKPPRRRLSAVSPLQTLTQVRTHSALRHFAQ